MFVLTLLIRETSFLSYSSQPLLKGYLETSVTNSGYSPGRMMKTAPKNATHGHVEAPYARKCKLSAVAQRRVMPCMENQIPLRHSSLFVVPMSSRNSSKSSLDNELSPCARDHSHRYRLLNKPCPPCPWSSGFAGRGPSNPPATSQAPIPQGGCCPCCRDSRSRQGTCPPHRNRGRYPGACGRVVGVSRRHFKRGLKKTRIKSLRELTYCATARRCPGLRSARLDAPGTHHHPRSGGAHQRQCRSGRSG
ncbi:hypothetical protein F5B21DRAFT_54732 [Xylaria acuta]|nr:hypothetical protein F5B21DRAFT_54732 [Xylaria acuta]